MKTIVLFISLSFFFTSFGHGEDSSKTRPFQMTFFYPLGTNGIGSPEYANNFSFNILYGVNGGVSGAEIGGLVNSNTGPVIGIQIAGIANVNTKHADGIIIGGISNVIKDSSRALCIAGISNSVNGPATGMHVGGITNLVNGDYLGAQIAGISNINNGDFLGMQVGGISNVNIGNFTGLQVSGISNINGGNFIGLQLGLINRAQNLTGMQLGLINIADSIERGVPLGLFSFVKKGYHSVEIGMSDAIYTNMNIKMGVKKLYTTYKLGYTWHNDNTYFAYGLGLGSMLDLSDRFSISIDAGAYHIIEQTFTPKINILSKADLSVRYNLGEHFSIYAGPSFNIYASEYDPDFGTPAINTPYIISSVEWWNNEGKTFFWIGGNAGIAVNF